MPNSTLPSSPALEVADCVELESVDPGRATPFAGGFERPVLGFLVAVHIVPLVLCALYPSWPGLWAMLILYLVTGWGVTVGYHRKLTHHSFKSTRWVNRLLAVCGLLSGEGPPIFWVAHHRKHHKFSDLEGDPHSPRDGVLWSHLLWLLPRQNRMKLGMLYSKWAPDMVKDPFYLALERSYIFWHLGLMGALFAIGWALGGFELGMSLVAYGFFLRTLIVLHISWMVNSLSHLRGYRNYATSDDSRNNVLVGLLAQGEGWHNNHHRHQTSANHGHRWWEVDLTFLVIVLAAAACWPMTWVGWGDRRPVHSLRFFSYRRNATRILFPAKS